MAAVDEPDFAERLAAWLSQKIRHAVKLGALATPSIGQSNDTVLLDVSWSADGAARTEALVLRRQPTTRQLFLGADVLREGHVLEGLWPTAVPSPKVRLFEEDASVIGAPFFVMDRLEGTVPAARPSIHAVGWLPTLSVAERRHLWESAMETFVAVHDVDWRHELSFLLDGAAEPTFTTGRLAWLQSWYLWATKGRSFPIADAALEHLVTQVPDEVDHDPVLLWGDPRVGNMLFSDTGDVVAALDWENAWLGHRAFDVAHWLFFDAFATEDAGVERLEGFPDRDETLRRYEELSGTRLPDLDYYEIAEAFFIAVTLIRQADLSVEAGTLPPDTTMGHGNNVTRKLARLLGIPEPELSADYLAHRSATSPPPSSGSR